MYDNHHVITHTQFIMSAILSNTMVSVDLSQQYQKKQTNNTFWTIQIRTLVPSKRWMQICGCIRKNLPRIQHHHSR